MTTSSRPAFTVHGHFYQPPREDPHTGEIPQEPGAAPYHDWNERIFDQCYRPNTELGNFARISFDLGPTLAKWMAEKYPATLASIIDQERSSYLVFGIGNGMAQAYNHTILPLSSHRDKVTQVTWGIQDFVYRFGHPPLGMWLPETAVDLDTLSVLSRQGIKFTILAPWQAAENEVDVSIPYRVQLPDDMEIAVLFFSQELSMRVSFDPMSTINADVFLTKMLLPGFGKKKREVSTPPFLVIASDGELFGHHQPFRDKFLEYLTTGALKGRPVALSHPGLWLTQHPPEQTISIKNNTSWSCPHGVKRWSEQCDCTPHAEWKAPLRASLDAIAEWVDEVFESSLAPFGVEAWHLRDDYGQVVCGAQSWEYFSQVHFPSASTEQLKTLSNLFEAQMERQRMYTSCGWFFDDFDRIEPRNNIAYASRAAWLTLQAHGSDQTSRIAAMLGRVRSWRSGLRGDTVFLHNLERMGS